MLNCAHVWCLLPQVPVSGYQHTLVYLVCTDMPGLTRQSALCHFWLYLTLATLSPRNTRGSWYCCSPPANAIMHLAPLWPFDWNYCGAHSGRSRSIAWCSEVLLAAVSRHAAWLRASHSRSAINLHTLAAAHPWVRIKMLAKCKIDQMNYFWDMQRTVIHTHRRTDYFLYS